MTMKTLLKTALVAVATAAFASCAASGGAAGTTRSTVSAKPYPKNTCAVSGNRLGSMGAPVTKTYGDREVKFCCKPCVAKFEKNPQKYLAALP